MFAYVWKSQSPSLENQTLHVCLCVIVFIYFSQII